ncbi:hypothetical protein BGX30_007416 [Mortierella sp. GBA39]|nr:hypothetical protein BGX30_007416 [Mortierella sp. GBA39]
MNRHDRPFDSQKQEVSRSPWGELSLCRDAKHLGRFHRSHIPCFLPWAQVHGRHPFHALYQRERRTGQKPLVGRKAQPALRREDHLAAHGGLVKSRRHPGERDRIADKNQVPCLRPIKHLHDRLGQMKTVRDDAGRQRIARKLFPQIIGMPWQYGMGAVPQVRGHAGTRSGGAADLLAAGRGMPDGSDDPMPVAPRDK